MSTLGFVGLGTMGGRIAGRLLATGHQVHGTNRTSAKAQPLIDRGLQWHATPREVAAAADVVFSMVSDEAALEAIADGADGVLAGLMPGKVYIDMSTVSPGVSAGIAERVRSSGAWMLDAPVSGSVPQAETGALTIMVGGDETAFSRVEPLLRLLGQTVTRVGANGQGLLLKLAINISLAVQMLAFSEGLVLAERGGIDPRLAARVMSGSSIGSPMLQARVPLLLELPERAWFDVALMHKDIRLALQAAADLGVSLPSAATADNMLAEAHELGYDERDIAALHQVLAHARRAAAGRRRAALMDDHGTTARPRGADGRGARRRDSDPAGGRRTAAAPRPRRGEHGRGGRTGRREQGHHLPLVAVEGDAGARRAARLGGRARARARHRIAARGPARPGPALGARDPAPAVRPRHRRARHRGPVRPAVRRGLPHPLRPAASGGDARSVLASSRARRGARGPRRGGRGRPDLRPALPPAAARPRAAHRALRRDRRRPGTCRNRHPPRPTRL